MGFTLIFATELLVNLIATWPREFLNDPWNHFDTFTVSVSVCTLMLPPSVLPPEGSDTLKVCRKAVAALAHAGGVHGPTPALHPAMSEPFLQPENLRVRTWAPSPRSYTIPSPAGYCSTHACFRRHQARFLVLLCMVARHPWHGPAYGSTLRWTACQVLRTFRVFRLIT